MSPTSLIQASFAGGELSPSLYSRVDIQKYSSSLKRCRNFIVSPHGGVKNRPGTVFVAEAKFSDKVSRVVRFIFNSDQAYVLEFGHLYVRFYTDQAQIQVDEITDNGINAQTLVMLHGDGTDTSTTFTDSSLTPHTITPSGTAQIDTAQSKFGGASMLLDGNSDYVSTPDFAALDLAAADFLIDCWVRRTSTSANDTICARSTSGVSYFYLAFEGLDLRLRDYVSGNVFDMTRTLVMSTNTWYHIEASRTGTAWRIFLNGVQQGATVTDATSLTARAVGLDIGSLQAASPDYYFNGWIDEFRFQAGTGAGGHTSNFTPRTTAYGIATTAQIPYEVTTEYTEDDLALLRFESSADVIYITHPDFTPQTLSRFDNDDWRLADYSSDSGPFMPENIEATTLTASAVTGTITLTASAPYFAALHVGALFKLTHYVSGQAYSNGFSGTGTGTGIKCFQTWRVISHGTWTGKFRIEKSTDAGSTWTTLRTFTSANDFNANTSGTEDPETNPVPFLVRINMFAYTSGTATIDLTTDPFYQEGIARVTVVTTNILVTATVLQEIGDTTAVDTWSEGSWSDYRGWPAVARFFQDRLCFSGTASEPMTTWMTEIGLYTSFFRHTPLLDTDAISVNLPSRQLNAINGLVALRKLVAFTTASEWTIGPISGNALTPTTTEQLPQGYRGSYGIDPAVVGNECVYVQANSKVIRNFSYQFGVDGYTGADLNILAKHLFEKFTITEMAYQQDPDSVVWCLRDDGILLGFTYMVEQEVAAWTWHDTGGNDSVSGGDNPRDSIESICTIPGQGFDELWMSVSRTNGRFIERMSQRFISVECNGEREVKIKNQIFLDSCVSFSNETDIENVTINEDGSVAVTITDHGLSIGDTVFIDCVDGPTQLNGVTFTIEPGAGDANTLFMSHFNGADNSTAATDSSQYGRVITRHGAVIIDTAQSVFGGASTYFPADGGTGSGGGTNFWSIPAHSSFGGTFWNGNWTLEGRYQFEIDNDGRMHFFSWFQNAFSYAEFYYNFITNKFDFAFRAGAPAGVDIVSDIWTPVSGTWYAIALVKSGDNYMYFVDGEQIGAAITNSAISTVNAGSPLDMSAIAMGIGGEPNSGASSPNSAFQGWIDEIRISNVARYTDDYDVAGVAFNDATNSFTLKVGGVPLDGTGYDSYVSGGHISIGDTSGFTGLDHLEGQTVGILADGEVLEQQVVVGGEVTLDEPHAIVHVGLPMFPDFETLNIEVGDKGATIQGQKVKIGNVTFRVEGTRGGWIGPDENTLYSAFETAIIEKIGDDDLTELFTGDLRMPLGAGFEDGSRIFYRQYDPLPVNILAVIPEVTVGGPSL